VPLLLKSNNRGELRYTPVTIFTFAFRIPSRSELKAATTAADPGASVAICGFVSVRRGAGAVVVGGWVSVLFCGAADLFVLLVGLVFVFDVRGRPVVEEFEFCAEEVTEKATLSKTPNINFCDICSSTSWCIKE
jgi:hypothetical protein